MGRHKYSLNMPFWQIGEAEHWYADQAAAGWLLRKRGAWLTRFDRGAPQRLCYRIELAEADDAFAEQKALYEQAGWQWITGREAVQVFAAPEGTGEIYTDCYEQAWTMKRLRASCWRCLDLVLVLAAGLIPLAMWRGAIPWLSLWAQGLLTLLLLLAPFYLSGLLEAAMGFGAAWRLQRRLRSGRPIDHRAPYRGARRAKAMLCAFCAASTLAGAALGLAMWRFSGEGPLPEGTAPVILMERVEGPGYRRSHGSDTMRISNNTLEQDWSPFAIGYTSRETGEAGGWIIQRALYTDFPQWGEQLAQEMIPQYAIGPESDFIPLEDAALSLCLYRQDGPLLEMTAAWQGNALFLSYWGQATPQEMARAAAKAMEAWAEVR